jgi:hypothetical protein
MRPLATSIANPCLARHCSLPHKPCIFAATPLDGRIHRQEGPHACEPWLYVGTNPVPCREKGGCFWWRVGIYFHEHRKFNPDNLESDCNDTSLQKQWGFVQSECNRLCGSLEAVIKRKLSSHGVDELVRYFQFRIHLVL